jgi:hypothetical protein
METKAISMKAMRCSLVRSKIVFNRRQLEIQEKERSTTQQIPVGMKIPSWPQATALTVIPSVSRALASRLPQ